MALIVVPSALLLWRGTAGQRLDTGSAQPAPGLGGKLVWATLTAVAAALIQYGSALALAGIPLLVAGVVLLAVALPKLLMPGSLRAARGLPSAPVLRGLAFGSLTASQVLIPLMLISERGLSPTGAGIVLTVGALGWSTGSWFKGRGTIGSLTAMRGGAFLIALGTALIALVLIDAGAHRSGLHRHGDLRLRHRRPAPHGLRAGAGDVQAGRGGAEQRRRRAWASPSSPSAPSPAPERFSPPRAKCISLGSDSLLSWPSWPR
ncbi:hypothetical protein [Nonomuraea dietziae]|uniref:hypothetical protein n=1 Tax=Nonomuraea dietziae TaxID=65515 RepID=UPI0031DB86DB